MTESGSNAARHLRAGQLGDAPTRSPARHVQEWDQAYLVSGPLLGCLWCPRPCLDSETRLQNC